MGNIFDEEQNLNPINTIPREKPETTISSCFSCNSSVRKNNFVASELVVDKHIELNLWDKPGINKPKQKTLVRKLNKKDNK